MKPDKHITKVLEGKKKIEKLRKYIEHTPMRRVLESYDTTVGMLVLAEKIDEIIDYINHEK